MIIIIMKGKNFVAHLDGLSGTPVAHHCYRILDNWPFLKKAIFWYLPGKCETMENLDMSQGPRFEPDASQVQALCSVM
jgi:hypothetical protein